MGIRLNNPPKNIVVAGFMGAGKTTIGLELSSQLGFEFVDTDHLIVERVGKSIVQIFADDGEPTFRQYENALVEELAVKSGQVIATGGGMLVNPLNRENFMRTSLVVFLDTPPEAIEARLQRDKSRPLAPHWRALYEQRRPAYEAIPHHIQPNDRPVQSIVEEIIQLWQRQLK